MLQPACSEAGRPGVGEGGGQRHKECHAVTVISVCSATLLSRSVGHTQVAQMFGHTCDEALLSLSRVQRKQEGR